MFRRLSNFCFLLLIVVLASETAIAQNTSNKGRDFWLGYGNHVRGYANNTQKMAVYVTSDVSTTGNIEIPGIGYKSSFTVTANSISTVIIPQSAYLKGEGLYNLGIHLTAARPVVVYAHIYDQNVSGATLVLPTPALGKEYYSINYTQISNQGNSFSYFFVVGVEDSTQVEITPSADTQMGAAGIPFIVNLRKGEVYQVLGKNTFSTPNGSSAGVDLTGSTIRSITTTSQPCKPVAVFSGSGKIAIGCGEDGTGSSDNLYQQVYPTRSWGKKFITVPLRSRNYDIIRVLKSDPAAVLKVNGTIINNSSFVNNFYYEFDTQNPNVIESDKPIQVVQYAVTQRRSIDCSLYFETGGDPEMIFLNSVEQNIDNITVYSTSAYQILNHYINVVIETSAAGSFRIDGKSALFSPVPGDPAYSYAQLWAEAGVHNLKADKGFNAIAYGFGNAESYGYSAGANVKSLGIELETRVKNVKITNGCVNEPLKFKVNLPYLATRLIWSLDDGLPARVISLPDPALSYTLNGLTYNVYDLPDTIEYNQARDYSVNVIAEKSLADGCGTNEQLFFDFSIFLPAIPKFTSDSDICAGDSIMFKDLTDGQGHEISSWLWDFGDSSAGINNSSVLQNPAHQYRQGGKYRVKLTVTNESNCDPVTVIQEIEVLNKPIADFSHSQLTCESVPVVFEDLSEAGAAPVNRWTWDFGDGRVSSEKAPVHIFAKAGIYEVTLVSGAERGCLSDPVKTSVVISSPPVVDFTMPEICLADAKASFVNKSIIDGDASGLKFLWNFGDKNAPGQRPDTSVLENPDHTYTAAGNYIVTLTVSSASGCISSQSKTFTVNGSIPKADFQVIGSDKLCSSDPVVFEERGSVDFGELTRIEWVFDLANAPDIKMIDDTPNKRSETRKRYTHQYPVFTAPLIKTYLVKMSTFSGEVCVNEKVIEIKIKAVPELAFDTLGSVCADLPPFQLNQARVLNNMTGQGRYSGPGVSASGTFNPATAGAGIHHLSYTFTSANNCSASIDQTITVIPLPTADAGADLLVLEGESVRLDARASGDSLRFKWAPSTFVDKDNVLNPNASPTEDITYKLSVTSKEGCVSSDEVFVKVLKTPVIPTAFTPNNDGKNDVWNIKYLDTYPNATVEVFNRFGNKVYASLGYTEPWKGKFNGEDLPVGTYYYIINPNSGRKTISGAVTILR